MVYINRCTPELPVSVILSQTELRALQVLAQKERSSSEIKSIGNAITVIAKLGGYLGRRSDRPPGIIVIWRGWQRLYEAASFLTAWKSNNCG